MLTSQMLRVLERVRDGLACGTLAYLAGRDRSLSSACTARASIRFHLLRQRAARRIQVSPIQISNTAPCHGSLAQLTSRSCPMRQRTFRAHASLPVSSEAGLRKIDALTASVMECSARVNVGLMRIEHDVAARHLQRWIYSWRDRRSSCAVQIQVRHALRND